MKCSLLLQNL